MPCDVFDVDGIRAIVCGQGPHRVKRCSFCAAPAGLLCDFPQGKKTCDKPICRRCAVQIANNVDFCPDHPAIGAQASLFAET